jgi:hypothetical protein
MVPFSFVRFAIIVCLASYVMRLSRDNDSAAQSVPIGKSVIVVGRSVGTSEGSWLDEHCGMQVMIQGRSFFLHHLHSIFRSRLCTSASQTPAPQASNARPPLANFIK